MIFILTSPHQTCLFDQGSNGYRRTCDLVASQAIDCLEKTLKFNHNQIYTFRGNIPRTICDLNRHSCRDQPFRQSIMNLINWLTNNNREQEPIYHLDIHSFSPIEEQLDLDFFIIDENYPQFDISNDDLEQWQTSFTKANIMSELIPSLSQQIIQDLSNNGYRGTIFPPSINLEMGLASQHLNINDISYQLTRSLLPINSILLEFSEDLTNQQINDICAHIGITLFNLNN